MMEILTDAELRIEALRLANQLKIEELGIGVTPLSPEATVERARVYYEFLRAANEIQVMRK